MRGELPYRDGNTSRPFRTDSDDVLFGAPIITIYLPCMRQRSLHNLSSIQWQVSKSIEFIEKTLDYMEREKKYATTSRDINIGYASGR